MFNKLKPGIPPKVVTIHDLSCFGRCAQTVIVPVLSIMKVQALPLPTALLSTHTGGFENFTFFDLSDEMDKITHHWKETNIVFDGVYSGFLASEGQIEKVLKFAEDCKKQNPSCLFLADPVMGDNGEKYKTYTNEMCLLTKNLVKKADIITPNLTEACILTDTPYSRIHSSDDIKHILAKLRKITDAKIIITGLYGKNIFSKKTVGCAYFDDKGKYKQCFSTYIGADYPGTGDVFASVALAQILYGNSIDTAVKKAEKFVNICTHNSFKLGTPIREGLVLETVIDKLV